MQYIYYYGISKEKNKKPQNKPVWKFGSITPNQFEIFFFLPITMYIVHYIYSSSIYYSEHHVNQIMLYISTQKYT